MLLYPYLAMQDEKKLWKCTEMQFYFMFRARTFPCKISVWLACEYSLINTFNVSRINIPMQILVMSRYANILVQIPYMARIRPKYVPVKYFFLKIVARV